MGPRASAVVRLEGALTLCHGRLLLLSDSPTPAGRRETGRARTCVFVSCSGRDPTSVAGKNTGTRNEPAACGRPFEGTHPAR
ncbi:hypothetical protein JOM49_001262 [Amycolatopsis magusensis]|uniref:Secreted protein n=1 Tax=Amycolatopsis magusensis TaxID=882444 RepID=A0ABS4PJZ6_9PSEU|nr:hypothetical protein [Amycolatopsis magusensis]